MITNYHLRLLISLAIVLAYTYAAFEYKWERDPIICAFPVIMNTYEEPVFLPPAPIDEEKASLLPNTIALIEMDTVVSEEELKEAFRKLSDHFLEIEEQEEDILQEIEEEIEVIEVTELEFDDDISYEETICYFGEQNASPIGGFEAFYRYVRKNLVYPREAYRNNRKGKVIIAFTVEKNGALSNFKLEKKAHPLLDAAALSVLRKSPAWRPGRQRGRIVRERMSLPIRFE